MDCRRLFAIIVSVVCPYRSVRKLHVKHSQLALDIWHFGVVFLALCVFDVGVGRLAFGGLFVSRWDFCVWSFAVGLLAQAFGDGLVVFVFLRCVLCLPMGFSHWVSALGFSVWLLLFGF